jgi:hypothetical protein
MSRNDPSKGYKTLKGKGSRLVREVYDNGDADDWVNVQGKEGVEDWKKGLLFLRSYAYQPPESGEPGFHLYRVEAQRMRGLVHIANGYGTAKDAAWDDLFLTLKRLGVMPVGATE